jgi:hypothetical protein
MKGFQTMQKRRFKPIKSLSVCMCLASWVCLASACGTSDEGDPPPSCETTTAASLCVVLSVPASFDGSPMKMSAFGFPRLPPDTMPNAFFPEAEKPAIRPDKPFKFEMTDISYSGTTNFYLTLFMEGTSDGIRPVADLDYVGQVTDLTFDGSPINLDPIELILYQEP